MYDVNKFLNFVLDTTGPVPRKSSFFYCEIVDKFPLDIETDMDYTLNMMNELDQFKEETAFRLFGRSRSLAIAGGGCVKCGESAADFRDELSRREYGISGFCQPCQDSIFGGPDGDDEKEDVLDVVHPIMDPPDRDIIGE